jgi:GNAT superfamily N-acetyltransferase
MTSFLIERASEADAAGIVHVLGAVVAERVFTAIDRAWPVEQEASYLASLSPREAFHVARDSAGGIVGFQSLDRWSTLLPSMAHMGQLGTFLLPQWRGLGVGRQLWAATKAFAREAAYEKLTIQV